MKANLVYNIDKQPIGIQLYPEGMEELKLIQSLSKAKFTKPSVVKKSNYDFETKVDIQITISRPTV